jgi:diadenylate cyclase
MWTIIQIIWRPVLEILILTVGIYYLLVFLRGLRGTRGWAVITGFVALLLTLALVTSILDLRVLRLLLGTFSTFFVVAGLVIFQPELRRLLAELGNQPYFNDPGEERENIEVIIETVERLADVRIGALIAIEQSIQLEDIVESGINVNCEATPEMLETIFFPNNAIHDGGVVMRGDRILKAACIFPLTQKQGLEKSMGTRHRAAIGLSEESDAIVIVVSEETGAISYAYKGHLERKVTVEVLRSFLTSILVKRQEHRARKYWLQQAWARIRENVATQTKKGGN